MGHPIEWGLVELAGVGIGTGPLMGAAGSGITLGIGAKERITTRCNRVKIDMGSLTSCFGSR